MAEMSDTGTDALPAVGPRILIVEDERAMREMLLLALDREGYRTRALVTGAGLTDAIRAFDPELLIFDIGLPSADGIALLPVVRAATQSPVMMLTARSDVIDKVRALRSGADHYVTKPVELDELLARIAAALRRPALSEPETIAFADIVLDANARDVRRRARRIDLTPREFALLEVLMRTPNRAFSKDELLSAVWGVDYDGDGAVVDRYVSYVRAKLEQRGEERVIQTVRGIGYALRRNSGP
jgi:two-component system response regulator MprA